MNGKIWVIFSICHILYSRYIKFSNELRFPHIIRAERLTYGEVGRFEFNCHYRAVATTRDLGFDVTVRQVGDKIDQFVDWDKTLGLSFYSDNTFATPASTDALIVGDIFYYEISWLENFGPTFPVVFYASSCELVNSDKTKSLLLIDKGCTSDLVYVTRLGDAYSSNTLHFSYKSFTFTSYAGTFDLSLSCTINFCLRDELSTKACGFDAGSCPSGFTP